MMTLNACCFCCGFVSFFIVNHKSSIVKLLFLSNVNQVICAKQSLNMRKGVEQILNKTFNILYGLNFIHFPSPSYKHQLLF